MNVSTAIEKLQRIWPDFRSTHLTPKAIDCNEENSSWTEDAIDWALKQPERKNESWRLDFQRVSKLGYRLKFYSLAENSAWILEPASEFTRVAPICSRLKTENSKNRQAMEFLRTLLCRIQSDREILLVKGTAIESVASFGCRLFNRQHLIVEPTPENRLTKVLRQLADAGRTQQQPAFGFGVQKPADWLAVAASQEIRVLNFVNGGTVESILHQGLNDETSRRFFVGIPSNSSRHLTGDDSILQKGAVGWYLLPSKVSTGSIRPNRDPVYVDATSLDESQFLSHFTRPSMRSQTNSRQQAFGDLLFDYPSNRGSLATLSKIVAGKKLLASNRLAGEPARVCCFTAAPLSEFGELRQYRSHLHRWDFLPYGIAIRRRLLETLGAKPVIYGDEKLKQNLPHKERVLFQKQFSMTKNGNRLDWSTEREWRVVGDINLAPLGHDDIFIFVPDESAAIAIAQLSHWPILLMDGVTAVC